MQPAPLRPDSVFALGHSRLVHEIVDPKDALLIDLEQGVYYHLEGVAATIWKSALEGLSLDAIAIAIERNYSGCEDRLSAAVAAFAQALIDEGLLTLTCGAANGASAAPPPGELERTPYRAPSLNRFTDLQDLLRADPICEVQDPND
jgi:hypothetical protein